MVSRVKFQSELISSLLKQKNEIENQIGNEIDFKLSLQEQQQRSVDPYGFNRTFIALNSRDSDKLNILQKRGITYEETQFNNFVFDKIICNGVLNIDKLELYKRLKTGGVFYVTTLSNKLFEFNLFENK